MMQTDLNEAERLLRSEIAQNPRLPETHIQLSGILLKRKRTMDALAAADAALALDRNSPDAHCARGVVLLTMEQPILAAIAFRRALAADPNHRDSLARLRQLDGGPGKPLVAVSPPRAPWSGTLVTDTPLGAEKIAFMPQTPGQQMFFGRSLKNGVIRDALTLLRTTAPERDRFKSAIDLQSGDGAFVGQLLRRYDIPYVVGINPSPGSIEQVADKNIFSTILEGGPEAIDRAGGTFDLMISLNQINSLGPLENWFTKIVSRLAGNGLILYSVEIDPGADITRLDDGHFSHSNAYIERLAASHGLRVVAGRDKAVRIVYGQIRLGYIGILARA